MKTLFLILFSGVLCMNSSSQGKDEGIKITKIGIEIPVQGLWNNLTTDDTYIFQSINDPIQITISCIYQNKKMSIEERKKVMLKILEKRIEAEKQNGESDVVIDEPNFGQDRMILLIRYQGKSESAKRIFAYMMFGVENRVINVYFEGLGMKEDNFMNMCRQITNSIKIN